MSKTNANQEAMLARVRELIETGKGKGVLTYKEIVEMLSQCLEVGYIAVMAGVAPKPDQPAVTDTVIVPPVNLEAYDSLCGKGVAVS